MVNANYFDSYFAVESLELLGLGLRFFIVFRAPLRNARVGLALSVRGDLFRFLELLRFPDEVFLARAIRCGRRLLCVDLVCELSNAQMFDVEVFGRIGPIFAIFTIRNVSDLCVFRFRDAAGVSNCRFLRQGAVDSHAGGGLYRALFETAVDVDRVIAFICFSTRRFGVLRAASVKFGNDLRRVGEDETVHVKEREGAANVVGRERVQCR